MQRSAAHAHVIKASAEDVDWLYGSPGPAGRANVAARWLAQGSAMVVVTDGANGATAWTPRLPPVARPAVPVQVADTIGAGDAFTSGLLDALARRDLLTPQALSGLHDAATVAAVLDDAALVAAITCSRPGADPPRREEIDRYRSGAETGT